MKKFQNTILIHQFLTIPSSFKELAQTRVSKSPISVHRHASAGNHPVQKQIIYSQQMDAYKLVG